MKLKTLVLFTVALLLSASVVQSRQVQEDRTIPDPRRLQSDRINGGRFVPIAGVLKDSSGQPLTGIVSVTFELYRDQEGGAPLWLETQNIHANQGHYGVLLGAVSGGVPVEIVSKDEPRWLGVRVNAAQSQEQPRLLLTGVFYAISALNAETLAGRPIGDFVLKASIEDGNSPASESGDAEADPSAPLSKDKEDGTTSALTQAGTPCVLAKYDSNGTDLLGSNVCENGGNVGIGVTNPSYKLHVAGLPGIANLYVSRGKLYLADGDFDVQATGDVSTRVQTNGGNHGAAFQLNSGNGVSSGRYAYFRFQSLEAAPQEWRLGMYGSKDLGFYNWTRSTSIPALFVRATDSKVGIGTTNPAVTLDVAGNIGTSANIGLPNTTDANTGVITLGGNRFLHNFGGTSTFLGTNAGNFTLGGATFMSNTGIGASVLSSNTTGRANTAVGESALVSNTAGSWNTATGEWALYSNTQGIYNTATGSGALLQNTIGNRNTATGYLSLSVNTIGSQNTANGMSALFSNTTGLRNTAVGVDSLYLNTAGNNNTAVGVLAGETSVESTGSDNTFIGYKATAMSPQLNNATAIGANAQVSISNALVLGDSTVSVGIGTTAPSDRLDVVGDVRLGTGTTGCIKDRDGTIISGTCSSDERLKQNIEPFGPLLEKLVQIQPVHFDWRSDEYPDRKLGQARSFGLIAQEVERVLPDLVTEDEKGFKAVKYSQLPLLLLEAVRELKAQNDSLREEIEALKLKIDPVARTHEE
jgi:hypothetical protein